MQSDPVSMTGQDLSAPMCSKHQGQLALPPPGRYLGNLGMRWGQSQRVLPRVFLNPQSRREVAGAHFAYEETEAGSSGPCLNHTVTLPETGTGRKGRSEAHQSSPTPILGTLPIQLIKWGEGSYPSILQRRPDTQVG